MPEDVFFEMIGGKRVFCCLSEPSEPPAGQKKLVIMSHGFTGSSTGPARSFVDFARLLVSEGFSVLRFDQPNSGNSEGDYIDSSFREWVETIAYLGKMYLERRYQLALLGQSMGATASTIATNHPHLQNRVKCLLLWAPGPITDFSGDPEAVFEESGQRYKGTFWTEARELDFFGCLAKYSGGIHLVYGEYDRLVAEELRQRVVNMVKGKGQEVAILQGQGHSTWDYEVTQGVYRAELAKLKQYFP
jgi:dienelactone hydrolase